MFWPKAPDFLDRAAWFAARTCLVQQVNSICDSLLLLFFFSSFCQVNKSIQALQWGVIEPQELSVWNSFFFAFLFIYIIFFRERWTLLVKSNSPALHEKSDLWWVSLEIIFSTYLILTLVNLSTKLCCSCSSERNVFPPRGEGDHDVFTNFRGNENERSRPFPSFPRRVYVWGLNFHSYWN